MNKRNLLYASEKFYSAIRTLVIAPGTLQDRIASAYDHFQTLGDENLPVEHVGDYQWILNQMTKEHTQSVQETMKTMPDDQAIALVTRILDVAQSVHDALELPTSPL